MAERSRRRRKPDPPRPIEPSNPRGLAPPKSALAEMAVIALALFAYANTLGHGFVWDDPISLQRWLPALKSVGAIFFPPQNIPQFPRDYYRPLQLLSYQFDRLVGGGAAWPFHLTVVLLHALTSFLMFRVGLRLFADLPAGIWAAFWSAILFAVHPIHSESVAWMAARPDVMVACFGMAAVLVFNRGTLPPWPRSILAAAFVLLALLSKENAVALLVLVPGTAFLFPAAWAQKTTRKRQRTPPPNNLPSWPIVALPFAVVAAMYALLRVSALRHMGSTPLAVPESPVTELIAAMGVYLRLLLVPYPQSAYISDLPVGWAGLTTGFMLSILTVSAAWHAWRRRHRPLLFALLWMLLSLGPSLAVVMKLPTAPVAERYLYLPSLGFCWALGWLVARALEQRRTAIYVHGSMAALAAVALVLTVNRNRVWRDNYSLWSDTAARNRVDGLPLRSLAAAHLERGEAGDAERIFHEALELRNDVLGKYIIYNNLGSIALNRDDFPAAERYYETARALQTTPDCLYNLALIALRRGTDPHLTPEADARSQRLSTARSLFEQALAASPFDPEIHIGLGQTAQAQKDSSTARRHFERGIELGLPPETEAAVRKLLKDEEQLEISEP